MIISKFQGRLGNQMFQYATALSVSKQFNTFFLIDNAFDSVFLKYFTPRVLYCDLWNKIMLKWFKKKNVNTIYQVGDEDVNEMKKLFRDNSYYNGFFQSEDYFSGYQPYLQKKFVIRKKYRNVFNSKYGQLFKENKIIAIHCRLGDYLNWGSDQLGGLNLTLPQSYYQNAIAQIDTIEQYKVIIVTDDLENVADKFDFIADKIIVSEEEIVDFQILLNADKLIISNSSFSWWAGYLSTKNKTVYAPEFWLGFKVEKEYPVGILLKSFIKIPVFFKI